MGDVVDIRDARAVIDQGLYDQREQVACRLERIAALVRTGDIVGVCVGSIPTDRDSIGVHGFKTAECAAHELVGASSILAAYLAANVVR